MANVCVFWTELKVPNSREWIAREIEQGRVRQGWGGTGTRLVDGNRRIPYREWVTGYEAWVRSWTDPNAVASGLANPESRFKILSKMLRLQKGDLLVVPHVPKDGDITLALVENGYVWDSSHFKQTKSGNPEVASDFGHYVSIQKGSRKIVRADATYQARTLANKFSNYRSAVNMVHKAEYAQAAWEAYHGKNLRP